MDLQRRDDKNAVIGRVLFDNCSQQTFITEKLRSRLKLPSSRTEKIMVKTFGSTHHELQKLDVVVVKIQGMTSKIYNHVEALVIPTICSPLSNQTIDLAKHQYPHLHNLALADTNIANKDLNVDILIGANYIWNFMSGKINRGESGPVAAQTTLGWVLNGSMEIPTSETTVNITSTHVLKISCDIINQNSSCNEILEQHLDKFWLIESTGKIHESEIQHNLLQEISQKITFNGKRYEAPLPWKKNHETLPDNFMNSKKQLLSSLKRLQRKPELLKEYGEIIKLQEMEGIIEKIPENCETTQGGVHYIPHHPVIREDKQTSKTRIVYNASSKREGPSLNDCLKTGPNMLPHITDILLRFRGNKIGLVSDIKKAFLNVGVQARDRDVLRFLWVDDINSVTPEIIIRRFTRVIFGSTSSQFLLNATIFTHLDKYKQLEPELC